MTKKTTTPTTQRDQHELENAPYLLKGSRIERNYELLPTTHAVDNNLVLDYIDCNDAAEAKRLRGWLWNAFAGGRVFTKTADKALVDAAKELRAAMAAIADMTPRQRAAYDALGVAISKKEAC